MGNDLAETSLIAGSFCCPIPYPWISPCIITVHELLTTYINQEWKRKWILRSVQLGADLVKALEAQREAMLSVPFLCFNHPTGPTKFFHRAGTRSPCCLVQPVAAMSLWLCRLGCPNLLHAPWRTQDVGWCSCKLRLAEWDCLMPKYIYIHMYICRYIYIHMYICIYIYMCVYSFFWTANEDPLTSNWHQLTSMTPMPWPAMLHLVAGTETTAEGHGRARCRGEDVERHLVPALLAQGRDCWYPDFGFSPRGNKAQQVQHQFLEFLQ